MKSLITVLTIAALISSCCPGKFYAGNSDHFKQRAAYRAAVKVTPGTPIAFKKINGKYIVLTEKPRPNDNITISVSKPN